MSGFLIGIFYANLIAKPYLGTSGIFDRYFLRQYIELDINPKEYLFYLLQVRLFPFSFLIAAGCTRWKSLAAAVYLVWTGFLAGLLAVIAVWGLGIVGMLLCIVGFFPHMAAYILAHAIVLWYLYTYPEFVWNHTKTAVAAGLMLGGILMEAYINPGIVRAFIRLLK